MKHSEQINELAAALAKAQGQMKGAEKDSKNPHLSNRYASLSAIIEAVRKPMSDNGLSFSQLIGQAEEGGVALETILMHSSGQWLASEPVAITALGNKGVNEAQGIGSGLTYFKRYSLAAMLGISVAEEDDDGNSAQVRVGRSQQVVRQDAAPRQPAPPVVVEDDTPGFSDSTSMLYQFSRDFGLTESESRALLKQLGFKGFPANGEALEKSKEMYRAVKAHIEAKK